MRVAKKGVVYLVGAGPGDPELLTLRAASLLASADIVLHDDLVPQAVLDYVHAGALIVSVGKRCGSKRITQPQIHTLMIDAARSGQSVVRLKSGDPLIFGRAGEEIQALRNAAVRYEVVSGITSAFAAAATLGISLTDRRSASKVIFVTGHQAAHGASRESLDEKNDRSLWRGTLPEDATLFVYMPGRDYRTLADDLRESGISTDMPCIEVSRAGQPRQQTRTATLQQLAAMEPAAAPVLLLIGRPLGTLLDCEEVLPEFVDMSTLADAR